MKNYTKGEKIIWVLLRLGMGWIFLWAFLDKTFGLGFATEAGKGWIDGSSPTMGFLTFATAGPFSEFFQGLAGSALVDSLYMLGVLGIGLALMLGVGMKIAGYSGALMTFFMILAGFLLPEHNPLIDYHTIYILVFLGLAVVPAGNWFGFGKSWSNTALVQKYRFLR